MISEAIRSLPGVCGKDAEPEGNDLVARMNRIGRIISYLDNNIEAIESKLGTSL